MKSTRSQHNTSKVLETPPPKGRGKNKTPGSVSTQSLSSMSMSFDKINSNFTDPGSPPSKRMKPQDIHWTNEVLLLQAFKSVGVSGSLKETLSDSMNIERLLGNCRVPYEATLHLLGIQNEWEQYKTKEFREAAAEAVAKKLRGQVKISEYS